VAVGENIRGYTVRLNSLEGSVMSERPGLSLRQGGSTLTGVMVGLLIGVVIAVVVALYINFGPKPFVKPDATPPVVPATPTASAPVALPGKPGDKPLEQGAQQFDFYKILPNGEAASAPAPKPTQPEPAATGKVYLQAGAFQDPSDADNLKARLSLMGIESNVQRVDVEGKGTWHRVRVGPLDSQAEADAMRARLAQEGIESALVRNKASAQAAKQ
jgi:cell division protein FtsN